MELKNRLDAFSKLQSTIVKDTKEAEKKTKTNIFKLETRHKIYKRQRTISIHWLEEGKENG